MRNLTYGDLRIAVEQKNGRVHMSWLGISEDRQPEKVLSAYFSEILEESHRTDVVMDFTKLEYMNSSTFVPVLGLVKQLNASRRIALAVYDDAVFWQRASFKALSKLAELAPLYCVAVESG
jgi:hypothetical protein